VCWCHIILLSNRNITLLRLKLMAFCCGQLCSMINPIGLECKGTIVPHRKYEVGTLAVDGQAVATFGTARMGLGGAPRRLLAVPNVTAHPSTASVPITILLYNGPLLCGFNAPIKGLISGFPWFTLAIDHIAVQLTMLLLTITSLWLPFLKFLHKNYK